MNPSQTWDCESVRCCRLVKNGMLNISQQLLTPCPSFHTWDSCFLIRSSITVTSLKWSKSCSIFYIQASLISMHGLFLELFIISSIHPIGDSVSCFFWQPVVRIEVHSSSPHLITEKKHDTYSPMGCKWVNRIFTMAHFIKEEFKFKTKHFSQST